MKRSKMDCVTLGRKAEKAKGGRTGTVVVMNRILKEDVDRIESKELLILIC